METFILKPNTDEQAEALKALAKAMHIYCEEIEDMALGKLMEQSESSEILTPDEAIFFINNLSK